MCASGYYMNIDGICIKANTPSSTTEVGESDHIDICTILFNIGLLVF